MTVSERAKRLTPEVLKRPFRAAWQRAGRAWTAFQTLDDLVGHPPRTAARLTRTALRPRRTVLCYPIAPEPYQVAYRILLFLGYRTTTDPRARHDVALACEPATVYPPSGFVPDRAAPAINRDARDISKRAVERAFEDVFGYGLGVDPATFRGRAVRKSDANYTHDAVVIECPHAPDAEADRAEAVTYQRYVDTRTPDGYYLDHRVPVYDGEVPLVYLKYHPEGPGRFVDVSHSEIAGPADVFTGDERRRLAALAAAMGVEYGEMDVLRDNADGRIYVVDVNRTPSGPVKGVTQAQRRRALAVLAPAFERMVERRLAAA
jgi:hypothetical protein